MKFYIKHHRRFQQILSTLLLVVASLLTYHYWPHIIQLEYEGINGIIIILLGVTSLYAIKRLLHERSVRFLYERAFSESETRFQHYADASDEYVWETDRLGRIVFITERVSKILDYKPIEIVGHSFAEFVDIDDVDNVVETFSTALKENKGFYHLECTSINKQGEKVWQSLNGVPLYNEVGQVTGFRGVGRDITGLKQNETELILAKNEAEKAHIIKTEFLATMSHEIRTPMNGVLGMSHLLLESALNSEQRVYAQAIQECGQSLLAIINDILDFSKLESGKLQIDETPFDLDELVENVNSLMGAHTQQKGIELNAVIAANVPRALIGDQGRIRQILLNMVGNAIKFTEKGGVYVQITLIGHDEGKDILKFEVIDTGIGIEEAHLDTLFDRFTQGDTSYARKFGGTGLGLAISKQLAELMHGQVGVVSKLHQGSNFWFELPLKRQNVKPHQEEVDEYNWLSGKKVLVVEDNDVSRLVLTKQLESWQMSVTSVANAQEALTSLNLAQKSNTIFDYALIDHMLPGLSGLELAKRMKLDTHLAKITLIMVTGVLRKEGESKAKKAGFSAFITKPVRQTILRECLLKLAAPHDWSSHATHHSDHETIIEDTALYLEAPLHPQYLHILLVEDNRVNQMLSVALLTKLGHKVEVVASGREALHMLAHKDFDIVFMDIQMPEMDGVETTKLIRAQEELSGKYTPIIALTANVLEDQKQYYLKMGMDDFIPKPINKNIFDEIIEKWSKKIYNKTSKQEIA